MNDIEMFLKNNGENIKGKRLKTIAIIFMHFIVTVYLISCSSSVKVFNIPKNDPTVNIKLLIKSNKLPDELMKYQIRLDSILVKSSTKKNTFTALPFDNDNADYNIAVTIDSILLIPLETQQKKLKIKDSVFNNLNQRQAHYDSSYTPLTDGEKTAILIISGIFGGGMAVARTMQNDFYGYETPRPTLKNSDKKMLKKVVFNPMISGHIKVSNKLSGEIIWEKKYILEDEYDKFVDYNEQVDMLIRWLIGKLRFTFNTPFISECSIEKVKIDK